MIKPKRLKRGDKIAIVSLAWGGLGDASLIHKYYIAKERLENDFGLVAIIYNVNIGHAKPIGILPYGIETELNCNAKTIRFLESPTK